MVLGLVGYVGGLLKRRRETDGSGES